jgi:hypothetical protein
MSAGKRGKPASVEGTLSFESDTHLLAKEVNYIVQQPVRYEIYPSTVNAAGTSRSAANQNKATEEKKGFNWGALIVGALGATVLVVASVVTFGATAVVSAAVLGAAAGAACSVAGTALGDATSGQLSSPETYLKNAVTGAITGAVCGAVFGPAGGALSRIMGQGAKKTLATSAVDMVQYGAWDATSVSLAQFTEKREDLKEIGSAFVGGAMLGGVFKVAGGTAAFRKTMNNSVFSHYKKLSEKVDVSTRPNEAVFYSGSGNREAAEAFARNNEKLTLNMTSGGKRFDKAYLSDERTLTQKQIDEIWGNLSKRYAQGSSGNVYGFVEGAKPSSIFNTVENPILTDAGNKQITNFFTELMK